MDERSNHFGSVQQDAIGVLEEREQLLLHQLRLAARNVRHALFVFGYQGRLGNRQTILRTLDDESVDPTLINGDVAPLSLFSIPYRHRDDAVVVFDDIDSMFGSISHLRLLRTTLWGTPRVVTFNISQTPGGLPSGFELASHIAT